MTDTKQPGPFLIVFGLDAQRRPRAGVFQADKAAEAIGRAQAVHFIHKTVEDPRLAALAKELKPGSLAAAGAEFAPPATRLVYERLLAAADLIGSTNKGQSQRRDTAADASPRRPSSWTDIKIGDLVLAEDPDPGSGWYEANVIDELTPDAFRITFRDYPEEGAHLRRRDQLALLPSPAFPAPDAAAG